MGSFTVARPPDPDIMGHPLVVLAASPRTPTEQLATMGKMPDGDIKTAVVWALAGNPAYPGTLLRAWLLHIGTDVRHAAYPKPPTLPLAYRLIENPALALMLLESPLVPGDKLGAAIEGIAVHLATDMAMMATRAALLPILTAWGLSVAAETLPKADWIHNLRSLKHPKTGNPDKPRKPSPKPRRDNVFGLVRNALGPDYGTRLAEVVALGLCLRPLRAGMTVKLWGKTHDVRDDQDRTLEAFRGLSGARLPPPLAYPAHVPAELLEPRCA